MRTKIRLFVMACVLSVLTNALACTGIGWHDEPIAPTCDDPYIEECQ